MSEIDAIPEDIKATAKRCLNDRSLSILDSVALALLAERTAQRERDAKIAEAHARECEPSFVADLGWDIADAIRKQQEPT